jgi:maleylacetoacetate isomerase
LSVGQKVESKFGEEAKKAWLIEVITEGMTGLENLLKKHAGKYSVGDSFTLADACLVPQAYACRRFGVDLNQFPTVARVLSVIENEECVKKSHPDQMPDAVKA